MAEYPDFQVRPGELFVVDGLDTYGNQRVSVMTLDPQHGELASAFGTIDWIADTTYKRREWNHGNALVYKEHRLKWTGEYDYKGDKEYEDIGPGWEVVEYLPFDITDSSIDEFYDVNTVSPPGKIEGDELAYSELNSRFEAMPGFGDPNQGINPSADLDDLVNVVYYEPIEENSLLKWDQVAGEWRNVYLEPFLSTRSDVNLDSTGPEDQQVLSYFAFEEKWKARNIETEGALIIPDGRRTKNKDLEYLVFPGTYESLNGKTLDYGLGVTSEPTVSQPYGHDYVLNGVSQIRAEGITSEYWDRFPKGAFHFASLFYNHNLPFLERTGLFREQYDNKIEQGLSKEFRFQNASLSSNITPIPGLINPLGEHFGDYTVQFWFQMDESANEADDIDMFDIPDRILFYAGYPSSADEQELTVSLRRVGRGTVPSPYMMLIVLKFQASGQINETLLSYEVLAGTDYHVAVQWDATKNRLKAWTNGVLWDVYELPEVNLGYRPINFENIRIGDNMRGYIADINVTLATEYNTDYVREYNYKKDFNPPGHWGRKLVEGPKAALKTLGLTETGYFSWISQEQPYVWTTAFSRNQFNTISQSLDINYESLFSGNILKWDAAEGKLASVKSIFAGDDSVSRNSGNLEYTAYNSIINPAYYKTGQGSQTGIVGPLHYHRKKGSDVNRRYRIFGPESSYHWESAVVDSPTSLLRNPPTHLAGLPNVALLSSGKAWQAPYERNYSDLFENTLDSEWVLVEDQYNDVLKWKQDLPLDSESFFAWGLSFRLSTVPKYGSEVGSISDGGHVTLRALDGLFVIDVYFGINSFELPNGLSLTDEWIYENGFRNNATITLRDERIKINYDYNIAVIMDSVEGKLSVYLNGRRQDVDVEVLVPVGNSRYEELLSEDKNAGLPQHIAIGSLSRSITNSLSPILFKRMDGVLLGAFASLDRRHDFRHQRYYDFSTFYDAESSQPGISAFTGAEFRYRHSDDVPDQFLQSSSELTKTGERLCQLDGEWIGSSRVFATGEPDLYGRNSDVENSFFRVLSDGDVHHYVPRVNGDPDYYAVSDTDRVNSFEDINIRLQSLVDGETLVYGSGYWTNSLIDDFSSIFINNREPIGALQDNDMLYWSAIRNGYIAEQPRNYIQYGLKDITNVEITEPLKSNDKLIYNSYSQKFEVQPVDYFSRISSLSDVSFREEIDTGDTLVWNASTQSFFSADPDPVLSVFRLADTRPPSSLNGYLQPDRSNYNRDISDSYSFGGHDSPAFLVWDERKRIWVTGVGFAGYDDNIEGEFKTYSLVDFYLRRHSGRMFNIGESGWERKKDSVTPSGNDVVHAGSIEFSPYFLYREYPILFVDSAQSCSNSQRGDGGDFNYAETHVGMALGIFGGGSFEDGEEDLPVEMIIGQDGGEFVEAIEPVNLPPRNSDPVFSNVALAFNFEGDTPIRDLSLRGSLRPSSPRGNTTFLSSGGAFGGGYVKISDWVDSSEHSNDDSGLLIYPEGRFNISGFDWSISFYLKTEETLEDRNEFLFSHGDINVLQYQEPRPTGLVLKHRFSAEENTSLVFFWRDRRSDLKWEFEMEIPNDTINYGGWEHFAIAYNAETSLLSVFYAGNRIGHLDLSSLEGMILDGMGENTWSNMYTYVTGQQVFCLGGTPDDSPYPNTGPLIGGIDDFKLTTFEFEYDPALSSIPLPGALVPEEFPPTFDHTTLMPLNPRIVSIVSFTGYPDWYYQFYSRTSLDYKYDNIGFTWGTRNSEDLAEGEDPLNPHSYPLFTPALPLGHSGEANYQVYSSHGLAVWQYNQAINGRWGGMGLVAHLTDDFAVNYEDFTFEAIHARTRPIEVVADLAEPPEVRFDPERGMILLAVAAEESLTDATMGGSWGVRLLTFENSFRNEGIRFEWWTEDGEYHHLDFFYGPEAFDGTSKDRMFDYDELGHHPWRGQGRNYDHTVVQRSLRRKSITVFHNNSRKELFHPRLAEPFRDISGLPDPRVGLGMNPRLTFESKNDFRGAMIGARMTRGLCLYGLEARFPDKEFRLSAT